MRARTIAIAVGLGLVFVPSVAGAASGKDVFLAQKCNKCHSVAAEKIDALAPEGALKLKIVDLSGVGKDGDAAFFSAYLDKTQAGKNGKNHTVKFKGTADEKAALVDWLAGLKDEAPR